MRRLTRVFSAALIALSPFAVHAQGQVVGPGGSVVAGSGPGWIPWTQAGGQAQVTTDQPRYGWGDVGYGSLRLSATGAPDQHGEYPDWAFWYRYAGGDAATSLLNWNGSGSFGALGQLSQLSFDWFRVGVPGWNAAPGSTQDDPAIPPIDWAYKTPVIRLQLAEQIDGVVVQTELIWEGYFNQQAAADGGIGGATPVDSWITSDNLHLGNFWYIRPALAAGGDPFYSTSGGICNLNPFTFWQGNAQASALSQLAGSQGCIAANAQVIGIAVGVGSQWPLPYEAYVDNVRLGFGPDQTLALDANFDFIVPEPSSFALMALGLAAVGAAVHRRRR